MALIPAKCTQCGANIKVDDSKEAGICEYCGTAFVTEKVIHNYNTYITHNYDGANINITMPHNEKYICPKCQSENIQSCKMIYRNGVKLDMSGQGVSKTRLSDIAKPPYERSYQDYVLSYLLIAFAGVGLVNVLLASLFNLGDNTKSLLSALTLPFLIIIPSYMLYKVVYRWNNKVYPHLYKKWEKKYICSRCGNTFYID